MPIHIIQIENYKDEEVHQQQKNFEHSLLLFIFGWQNMMDFMFADANISANMKSIIFCHRIPDEYLNFYVIIFISCATEY